MIAALSLWRTSLGTIMKLLLCIALLLLAAELSESFCNFHPRKAPNGLNESSALEPPIRCIDPYDGASFRVGETWLSPNCMRCSCRVDGYSCCTTYMKPLGYSEDCVALFNPRGCRYRVYRKDDPSIECEVHGGT